MTKEESELRIWHELSEAVKIFAVLFVATFLFVLILILLIGAFNEVVSGVF